MDIEQLLAAQESREANSFHAFENWETAMDTSPPVDDEEPSDESYADSFLEPSSRMKTMTNLTGAEFAALWSNLEGTVLPKWSHGRGRKPHLKAKDAFFFALVYLKSYPKWEFFYGISRRL